MAALSPSSFEIRSIRDTLTGCASISDLFATAVDSGKRKIVPIEEMDLALGDITPATKTALLVAQAAERIFLLSQKAEEISRNHANLVISGDELDAFSSGYMAHDDAMFSFIYAANRPEALVAAQATWLAAQIYLNNEVKAVNDAGDGASFSVTATTLGTLYVGGFVKASAAFYAQAADMLHAEGHGLAATRIGAVGKAIADIAPAAASLPSECINQLQRQHMGQDRSLDHLLDLLSRELPAPVHHMHAVPKAPRL